jgi:hypothetical protein
MFRFLFPSRSARHSPPPRKAQLSVELLEHRFCPAGPVLSSLGAVHIGSSLVVAGHVNDPSPSTVDVNLTGAVATHVTPNNAGDFSYICPWLGGGTTVNAQATDSQNLISPPTSILINNTVNANPFITLSVTYGAQRTITLTGQVADAAPGGLTVMISGSATGTTITDANGKFSVTLTASSLGAVYAATMDSFGQYSNTASVVLTSAKPVIENFYCTVLPDGWYQFSGRIVDDNAAGLTVYLGGVPVSLQNQKVTVLADGTFTVQIQLNGTPADNGTVTANVTDWWGQAAATAYCDVQQTGVG